MQLIFTIPQEFRQEIKDLIREVIREELALANEK